MRRIMMGRIVMRWIVTRGIVIACAVAAGCGRAPAPGQAPPAPAAPADRRADEHSYAEPARVRIERLALDLRVDFGAKQLAGTAELALAWAAGAPYRLVLDTRDLVIERVEALAPGEPPRAAPFTLGPRDPILGSPLTIELGRACPGVRIAYRTTPRASGLQWLEPAMTAGGRRPLLFTQSQAIHARSWVPLQDTPGVRFSYTARIRTPPDLVALMSAANDPALTPTGDYRVEMPEPIPSYLLALAVGDLVFAPISPRAGVWAERGVVAGAAAELADTERMIEVAERLYGPYHWGRYDQLILPPSFPFGGMENPRLSFITPTVIVGDRSLVSLIAHELAHSWSGNLVTNATWRDAWLSEGFTTYVEHRIVEAVYGQELADMEVVLQQRELRAHLPEVPAALQRLRVRSLAGLDPDAAAGEVAYGKGQWFLLTLERRFGRPALDAFLRGWFARRAFQSVTTDELEAALRAELMARNPRALTEAELAEWLDGPGVPAGAAPVSSPRLGAVDAARARWLGGGAALGELGAARWGTQERAYFLEGLPAALPGERLAALDAALALTGTANGELAQRWYPLAIRSGYAAARPAIAAFLERVGRRRHIMPIYRALAATPEGRALAGEIFARARPGYHPITAGSVEALLASPPPR